MSQDPLASALLTLSQDLVFATLAREDADEDTWRSLASRRAGLYDAIRAGAPPSTVSDLDAWSVSLVRALAPIATPSWLPMGELASAATLTVGARGLRSLFSSKHSEKDAERAARLGAAAVRVAVSVMGTDGALSAAERRLQRALAASLGLSEAEEANLCAIGSVPASDVELPTDLDAKTARLLVRGAWLAAGQDGFDAADEGAIATLANRLGVPMPDVGAAGVEVKKEASARHALAHAAISGLAYLLFDDRPHAGPIAHAIAELSVPTPYVATALSSVTVELSPPPEPQKLDRSARAAALAIAWAAALGENPTTTRRALLAARHDRVAESLGGEGAKSRASVEAFLDSELGALHARAR